MSLTNAQRELLEKARAILEREDETPSAEEPAPAARVATQPTGEDLERILAIQRRRDDERTAELARYRELAKLTAPPDPRSRLPVDTGWVPTDTANARINAAIDSDRPPFYCWSCRQMAFEVVQLPTSMMVCTPCDARGRIRCGACGNHKDVLCRPCGDGVYRCDPCAEAYLATPTPSAAPEPPLNVLKRAAAAFGL